MPLSTSLVAPPTSSEFPLSWREIWNRKGRYWHKNGQNVVVVFDPPGGLFGMCSPTPGVMIVNTFSGRVSHANVSPGDPDTKLYREMHLDEHITL